MSATLAGPVLAPGLPIPLTSVIGRDRELAEITDLLSRDGVRLVTLTGPGGVGKTRLALAVAAAPEIASAFPAGVRFVDLAPIAEASLVLGAIAHACGVREVAGDMLAVRLAMRLRHERALLVLDNVEHVLDAAPAVADLLRACPLLKVLATSRVRLRVSGEHEYPIPPLAVEPDDGAMPSAVRLFVERARASGGALGSGHGEDIAAICRRLDGLPLAIELAAARSKLLPPAALLARLDRPLAVLTAGGRDLPARQQTMRNTVAWSVGLLAGGEQVLFRRLAVFVGGFTLEAAAAVAAGPGDDAILDGVAALLDAGLIRREAGAGGEPRLAMFETVRHFGLEQLAASGEATAAAAAHGAFFVALAETAARALREPGHGPWLNRLDAELGNLRAAFAWAIAAAELDSAARATFDLCAFWWSRGHLSETRHWLDRLVDRSDLLPPPRRGWLLVNAARMALVQGDIRGATSRFEQAVVVARAGGDRAGLVTALLGLTRVALRLDDLGRADHLMAEVAAIDEAAGRPPGAVALLFRGMAEHRRDRVEQAISLLGDAVAHQRASGNRDWVADALVSLGDAECDRGDRAAALARYAEALEIWLDLKDGWGVADALVGFADVAATGQPALAARLLGAAEARYAAVGIALPPPERPHYGRALAAAERGSGSAAFAASREAGRALGDDAVLAEAAAVVPPPAPTATATAAGNGATLGVDSLSRREREVWQLLAQGRSNAEIASALFISPRTATTHVTHLYAKLGVASRAEAIVAAHRLGRA
jgi:non-specific serine/threonine protein kinase